MSRMEGGWGGQFVKYLYLCFPLLEHFYQSLRGQGDVFALLLLLLFKLKSKLGLAVGLKQNSKEEKGSERSTVLEKLYVCVWGGSNPCET